MMEFETRVSKVFFRAGQLQGQYEHLRRGQALMNAYSELYPEEAREINNTEYDPYLARGMDDNSMKNFMCWLIHLDELEAEEEVED